MIQFIQFYQLGDCTLTINEHATRLCFVYGEYDKNFIKQWVVPKPAIK